jgi:hypothetical protein
MIGESGTVNRPTYILGLYRRSFMLDRLVEEAWGQVFSNNKVVEINEQGVVIEKAGGRQTIKCDKVLPAWNRKPRTKLYQSLKGQAPEVCAAGNRVAPGDIYHSIGDGAYCGRKI